MARTPEQRGPFGRWLVRERKARGWTADEMRARLQEARGFAMAHSTYALLESGQRQPTDEQARHLTAFLGSEPEADASPAPAGDLAAVVLALAQQQAELVAELRRQNGILMRLLGVDDPLTMAAVVEDARARQDAARARAAVLPASPPPSSGPDTPARRTTP